MAEADAEHRPRVGLTRLDWLGLAFRIERLD